MHPARWRRGAPGSPALDGTVREDARARVREPCRTGTDPGEGKPAVTVDVDTLLPILRRVVGARVSNPADAQDLVQEALARILQHRDRIDDGMLEPYAITTARNLVAT